MFGRLGQTPRHPPPKTRNEDDESGKIPGKAKEISPEIWKYEIFPEHMGKFQVLHEILQLYFLDFWAIMF